MVTFSKTCKPSDIKAMCPYALIDVKVYFQRYPDTHGPSAARGIPDVKYKYSTAHVADQGKTDADGLVLMRIKAGETSINLRIFATTYQLHLVQSVDAVTTLKGAQWRLSMLGYEVGTDDGIAGKKSDLAVQTFQADNPQVSALFGFVIHLAIAARRAASSWLRISNGMSKSPASA